MDCDKATTYLVKKFKWNPSVFVVYTNALAKFPKILEECVKLSCHKIPQFPRKNKETICPYFLFGKYHDIYVLVMVGRYHIHDGYSTEEIVLPIKVAYFLGCKTMFLTGAAGSINEKIRLGDLMVLNALTKFDNQKNIESPKQKLNKNLFFHDETFAEITKKLAIREGMDEYVKIGKYAMVGDNLKSTNDIRALRSAHVDAVGTSLIPEVLTAQELGLSTFGIVVMTDVGILDFYKSPDPSPENIAEALEPKKPFIQKLLIRFFEYCNEY